MQFGRCVASTYRSSTRDSEMTRIVSLAPWLMIFCLGWLAGCGPTDNSPTTYPVKGTVNVDGAPLASGRIIFEDIPRGINNAVDIVNGTFDGQAAPGDLKARVEKVEKTENPMLKTEQIETVTPLKGDIPVTIKTGSNTLPPIDITTGG
jgi:hypothetical protein